MGAIAVGSPAVWAQTVQTTTNQTAEQTAPAARDVIIITGTRLRSENLSSPNPTQVIGAENIEATQVSNAIDVIEAIPLMGIGSNAGGTQGQNGDSFAFPDVLDLGTQRTLTLLNGRRVVAGTPGTVFVPGNASGSQVDISVFSPNIIERVDVLAGTGGAIYGADAVGGVVNFITKDNFEGFDLRLQAGITQIEDGGSFRISGTWGSDFNEGRGNIMASLDIYEQGLVTSSADRDVLYLGSGIPNVLEGSTRNTAAFNAQAAVDAILNGATGFAPAFNAAGTDGISTTYFGPLAINNPLVSQGGTVLSRGILSLAATTPLVSGTPVAGTYSNALADPQGFSFFAPSSLPAGVSADNVIATLAPGTNTAGLTTAQVTALAVGLLQRNRPTPYEYYQANPTLNPNLFWGTFGTGAGGAAAGGFLTIANTDAATSALFPRVAVPLSFDAAGNLVPYNAGALTPPLQGRLNNTYFNGGYDSAREGHLQVQAGIERVSFTTMGNYDLTDNMRYRSFAMYTNATYDQVQGAQTNAPTGSTTGGSLAVPVYIDQNPLLSQQSIDTLNTLQGQGAVLPTLNGQRVFYMGRALTDVVGGANKSSLEVQNYQITQSLDGDFSIGPSDFYWDVAASYGRSEQNTKRTDIREIEFALATDVVNGPNGPVCRQQTLAQPESITLRDPNTAAYLSAVGLVPTAAQVAACTPLNLFGSGAPSQEAIDYVTGNADVNAINTLEYYTASLGSDLFELPAGPLQLGVQMEYRREFGEFEPSIDTNLGLGRTALQGRGKGNLAFTEYGYEVAVPIFGGDFTLPGFHELNVAYALRMVEREQESETALFTGDGTKDDTFNYSLTYSPIQDISFRGAKSRTVRSASLVELVGPFTQAFTALAVNTHPCNTTTINQGPNPAVRRANCITAVQNLGIAANDTDAETFLASFVSTAGTRPAIAAGNPGLSNEEANTYTMGVTFEPRFIPRLVLAADFFSVDLTNEIGLVGPDLMTTGCFDSTDFPNSIIGGARACETFLFGTPTGPGGQYVLPGTNDLTGNPGIGGALVGSPAFTQAAFELAFAQFTNLNIGKREFRGVNVEARYNFGLDEVPFVGGFMSEWGDIFVRGTYFHTQRYDVFGNGVTLTDRLAGEHTNPEHKTRFDFRHRLGNFDHTLQWFWQSRAVTNIQTAKNLYAEQTPSFSADAFSFFNYLASYNVNDNLAVRLSINNLLDTEEPRNVYGIANNYDAGIGREFIIGLNASF